MIQTLANETKDLTPLVELRGVGFVNPVAQSDIMGILKRCAQQLANQPTQRRALRQSLIQGLKLLLSKVVQLI